VNLMFMVVRMAINPGATENFRKTLAEVVRIAKEGSDGLVGYEWFLSPDGRDCTVIEVYDGPAAHAKHVQRVVLPHAGKLREYASSQMSLAGNVPDEMLKQMRGRLGDVPYLGVQIAGLLDAFSTNAEKRPSAMSACIVATGTITSNKMQNLRELADASARDLVGKDDVIAFEWFLNQDDGSFAIIGMGRTPATITDRISHALDTLRTEGASEIALDAVGLDPAEVAKRFGYSRLGRVGGERIEGVL